MLKRISFLSNRSIQRLGTDRGIETVVWSAFGIGPVVKPQGGAVLPQLLHFLTCHGKRTFSMITSLIAHQILRDATTLVIMVITNYSGMIGLCRALRVL